MASSTSPSNPAAGPVPGRLPRRALALLAIAMAAWAAGAAYSLHGNPEVAFFRRGVEVKRDYERQLRSAHPQLILACGGSSCGTAIDGRRLLETHGLPVVNLGVGAGLGARVLLQHALGYVRPGDTLLVAIEPDLLAGPVELEPLGIQVALAARRPDLLGPAWHRPWPALLLDLRPGGAHVAAMLGKWIGGQPAFRYPPSEWQPDGRHEVAARRPIPDPVPAPVRLSPAGRAALAALRDDCAARGVRVAYVLRWQYCPPALRADVTRQHLRFLQEVAEYIPVLREPSLGAHPVREHFADMGLHPTAAGAALRSDELAASLSAWRVWTRADLAAAVAADALPGLP